MTWIQTYTGKQFHYDDVESNEIDILDVAHALSHQCRFAGHTSKFYSVAEHSILCMRLFGDEEEHLQKWALLHDAAEAYTQDIVRPMKHMLKQMCPAFGELEERIERHVWSSLGLEGDLPEEIKITDVHMLLAEREALLCETDYPWELPQCAFPDLQPRPDIKIYGWQPGRVKGEFLWHHENLFIDPTRK